MHVGIYLKESEQMIEFMFLGQSVFVNWITQKGENWSRKKIVDRLVMALGGIGKILVAVFLDLPLWQMAAKSFVLTMWQHYSLWKFDICDRF